jgi:hypothetical protein
VATQGAEAGRRGISYRLLSKMLDDVLEEAGFFRRGA